MRLTPENLLKAIAGEQNTIAFYEHMKTMTNDDEHIETLSNIIMDEHRHLKDFEELYRRRFGRQVPSPEMEQPCGSAFTGCLRRAAGDELDTAEFYREYRDLPQFHDAMLDEMEHAVRLGLMYSREIEKRVM